MKKIYFLLIALTIASVGFGQTTLHCWDFNGTVSTASPVNTNNRVTGTGTITHNIANVGAFGGSTINACTASVAGNAFCPQGGTGNVNNGKNITLAFSTTGYENIILTFAVQKTGAGFSNNQVSYSTNGGTSFTNFGTAFNPPLGFATQTFDFSAIPAVNNNANFQIRITVNGATDAAGNNRYDNIKLTGTATACTPPAQATAYNSTGITTTTGTLNWTRNNGTAGVLVVMRNTATAIVDPTNGNNTYVANTVFGSGSITGTGNFVVYKGTGTTVNVTGLSQNTNYSVAIYEYNTTGTCYNLTELTGSFSTLCTAVTSLPFNEGFETGVPPTCWTQFRGLNGLGTNQQWQSNVDSHTGAAAAYVQWEDVTGGLAEDWLVTPALNLSLTTSNQLTFYAKDGFPALQGTIYTVSVSTTSQTNIASFVPAATYTEAQLGNTYNQKIVDLSAYDGQPTVYIAFVMTQDDGDAFFLDTVSVNGSCVFPTTQASAYNTTNINAAAGTATLNWTRGNGNNVLVVAKAGSAVDTDPMSGIGYTASTVFGSGTEIGTGNYVLYNGPASSVNISNLTSNTTYHVALYEYNNLQTCYRLTELQGNFVMPCLAIFPLNEGFETGTIPACWTKYRGTNGLGTVQDWMVDGTNANSGTFSAHLQYEDGASGTSQDWLVTPAIDLTSIPNSDLTFFTMDSNDITDYGSSYTVRISTTSQTSIASFSTVATYTELQLGSAYNQKTINLAAYSGQTIYIAFVMEQDLVAGGDDWYLDDVVVDVPPISMNSDIVEADFDEPDNINYLTYFAASGLTELNAIKVGEFTIRDGGSTAPDADSYTTTLTNLSFTVQNFGDIAALAIFDGIANLGEITSVAATTAFSSLSLVAPDNGSKTFSVYATFKSTVTDNNQIQLTVASATANGAGSIFAAANAGGAATSVFGDDNKIEVTATQLVFNQQPTNTFVNAVMSPSPTVRALDSNNRIDLDYATLISLSTTGTFAGTATTSVAPLLGVATFNNLIFSATGTGFTTTPISALTNVASTPFDILAVPTFGWQINLANQLYTIDFDTSIMNVNNGAYAGTGLIPSPASGQLNSGAWASTGLSDGTLAFGGSRTTGDYANGTSTGGVTSGGLYSFDVGTTNYSFGVQPTGTDFTPGNVTLRAQNQTGQTVTTVDFQYTVYVNNNEGRSNSFDFAYSDDNTTYVDVASLDITSAATADALGFVPITRNISITGLNISAGGYVYMRWTSDDVGGSGGRDEFGLDDISVVFNPLVTSNESNIVENDYDEPDNIDYLIYNAASGLTTVNAIKIGEFKIQDGGTTLTDADNFSTTLTDLSFDVQNFGDLAALAIFDGASNVSEVTNVINTTTFSGLSLEAIDNNEKVFSVYATFKTTVVDNDQVQLTISSATASLTGSGFATADAGAAQTSVLGNDNRIDVIATSLSFVQQPSDVNINQAMVPAVTVATTDVNGNRDTDFAGTINMTSTGTFAGIATTSATTTAGLATFVNLAFSNVGTFTLIATSGVLTDTPTSTSFIVSLAPKSFWFEPFTNNLQYNVTAGAEGSNGTDNYFQITDGTNIDKTYTGNIGNFFAAQDIDDGGWAGSATPSQLTWSGINISRYRSLKFSGKFASVGGGIDATDFILVEYRVDGGAWQNLVAFRNNLGGSNENFHEDTNFDGTGNGIQLTSAFQNFTKSIGTGTIGSVMDLRITIDLNSGNEEIALEDFKLRGIGTVFHGNAATGFGGVVGTSTLEVYAGSGTNVDFIYNRGASDFNDYMVIYIDSKAGGIATTANLTDTGDDGRKAISGYDGANRSTITFPPGFRPDYAISMNNGFAGLFEIVESGSHTFLQSANLSPTGTNNASAYAFNITFANIVTTPGLESFKFLATYLNGSNAFRSNESIGRNSAGATNPGAAPIEFETYFQVTGALQGGKAPTLATGVWTADNVWLNGNPPLDTDEITINHDINQNIDATVNSIIVNAGLDNLAGYTLTTSGGITGTGTLDVFGKLSLTDGGFTDIIPIYAAGSTLEYKNITGIYNRYNEWPLGAAPSNVIIDNSNLDLTDIGGSTATENFNIGNDLSVLNSGTLNINATKSLTVGNSISNIGGTVNLGSTSQRYSSLIANSVTGGGTFNYDRHINGQPGIGVGSGANDLISPPVSGQIFSDFATANTNLRSNPNPGMGTQKLFGPFSKSSGTYILWDTTANGGETLDAGVGYRTASIDNNGFIFTGTVNTGSITNNIVNSGPQFAAYNLIGNPYTSYINVREFLEYDVEPGAAEVRNIDLMTSLGAIYGYDGDAAGVGSNGWVVYNLTTATTVNMTPGQGFLVTADAAQVAAYDMTFTPSMRRIDATDDFIPGRMADENNVHLKLQASIGTSTYNTNIFFIDNTTSGMDFGYDAAVFGSNAPVKSIYTHLVQGNTGADLAIQALDYADLGSDIIVPLGINVPQGQQVTVSIAESDLPSNIDVYLEDVVNGSFTLLNTTDFVFTATSSIIDTGRFYIRFNSNTLSTETTDFDRLQIYTLDQTLFVNGLLNAETTVTLFDIQGRKVLTTSLESGSTNNTIDVSKMSSGVYVVKLNNATQQKTQRVIIK